MYDVFSVWQWKLKDLLHSLTHVSVRRLNCNKPCPSSEVSTTTSFRDFSQLLAVQIGRQMPGHQKRRDMVEIAQVIDVDEWLGVIDEGHEDEIMWDTDMQRNGKRHGHFGTGNRRKRRRVGVQFVLWAVVYHSGHSSKGGHFSMAIRSTNDEWQLHNDEKVQRVVRLETYSPDAYLMFYKRDF